MRKNVQISFSLFMDLLDYFVLEISEAEAYKRIVDGLNQKIDKMIMHDLYEKYKTAPTEEEREAARQEYLDKRGVMDDFRW